MSVTTETMISMTPEAVALAALDNLDAKVHTVTRDIRDDRGAGAWTPFSSSLQRRLFKGLTTCDDAPAGLPPDGID